MTIFEIDPLNDPRWRAFVEWRPDASVFHRVEWLQALKSCYGYVPVALSFTPPGSPLENGLLFCEIRSALTGNRLVSLPFSDHCEPLVDHPEEIDFFGPAWLRGLTNVAGSILKFVRSFVFRVPKQVSGSAILTISIASIKAFRAITAQTLR